MRIHKKSKYVLVFECRCNAGDSWIRFDRIDGNLAVDKADMCCFAELTPVNTRTFKKWLFGKRGR